MTRVKATRPEKADGRAFLGCQAGDREVADGPEIQIRIVDRPRRTATEGDGAGAAMAAEPRSKSRWRTHGSFSRECQPIGKLFCALQGKCFRRRILEGQTGPAATPDATNRPRPGLWETLERRPSPIRGSVSQAGRRGLGLMRSSKPVEARNLSRLPVEFVTVLSRNVLKMLQDNEPGWEPMVPNEVAALIKQRHLLGYQG